MIPAFEQAKTFSSVLSKPWGKDEGNYIDIRYFPVPPCKQNVRNRKTMKRHAVRCDSQ
jgi:hypothetical protein